MGAGRLWWRKQLRPCTNDAAASRLDTVANTHCYATTFSSTHPHCNASAHCLPNPVAHPHARLQRNWRALVRSGRVGRGRPAGRLCGADSGGQVSGA
ncbi:MAG: hypothetical protein RL341_2115 [Pseudomonadota bacterium]|jgi:hypothetical protein